MARPDALPTTVDSDRGSGAPAVSRAMRILDLLADARGPRTLTDIARELGIAKSSTSNLCAALEDGRLIRRAGSGFLLGRRTVELGSHYLAGFDPVREFYRLCEESPVLSRQLVQIALLDGTRVLYLAVHEGRERFTLSAGVGDRYPASATAVGTALLSELDDGEIAARFADDHDIVVFTDRSTSSARELLHKIRAARERGYAIDDGELHPSVLGLAFAVPAATRSDLSLAMGVSLVRPIVGDQEEVVAALRVAAAALSRPPLVSDTSA
ncbi:IclR family transcriptional regulator [Rathayibacter rathayi]|uniref:IclR family transcriptional regulator n=1 Tax=Rathayibacter rathayi TaxID=33887 RepID=UPI000CE8D32D|nr:IclR family transcriptional regulator [Rathayibacter rathayi]PPF21844.1 IclR family transcriptional regulator [Rathayibacter rathayi]